MLFNILKVVLHKIAMKVHLFHQFLTAFYSQHRVDVLSSIRSPTFPTIRICQSSSSLLERSEKHDLLLPLYPRPTFPILLSTIIRLSSLLNGEDAHWEFVEATQSQELVLRSVFDATVAQEIAPSERSGNWSTERKVLSMLVSRKPLCYQSLNCTLVSNSNNPITSATRLLRALGEIFVSTEIIDFIGTDGGKEKKFETIQLAQLFATTRIPGHHKDELRTSAFPRHVIVWAGGRAFKVDILDSNRRVISESALQQQIQAIQEQRRPAETRQTVASLSTSLSRSIWAERRALLLRRDYASLDVLESAISSVALEDYDGGNEEDELRLALSDTGNVYSDKTMGFSIFPNGDIACRIDHAAADGGVMGRLLQALSFALDKPLHLITARSFTRARYSLWDVAQTFLNSRVFARFGSPIPPVQELQFDTLSDGLMDVSAASLDFEIISRVFDLVQHSDRLSKLRAGKLLNFTVQLAFQIAIFTTFDSTSIQLVEPTSVRNFASGRSDPNYVVTKESISFFRALGEKPNEDLLYEFSAAYVRYRELLVMTKEGAGLAGSISLLRKGLGRMQRSMAQDLVYQTLGKMQKRTVWITGDPLCPGIGLFEAYVWGPNQIALAYAGRQDGIKVSISASGDYCALVESLKSSFQNSFSRVLCVADAFIKA